MTRRIHRALLLSGLLLTGSVSAAEPNWGSIETETMQHFQTLLRFDTSDPPGHEAPAVEYLKGVLEREGIEVKILAVDPKRPNLIARLKGNGKKRPLLLMAHTDVVNVDLKKWTHPPFSATRADGYVYGRGSVDDKDNVTASLMTLLMLKRAKTQLDRDVIFLAEAGEEGSVQFGIEFIDKQHRQEIDAEFCIAEGGGISRTSGKVEYAAVATTEKLPVNYVLTARGPSGHGSVPLQGNAIAHLAAAVDKIANWRTPLRFNETTRAYFERLAAISKPADAARYRDLLAGKNLDAAQDHLAAREPRLNSTLRTSISPNIIQGGYRFNVIPSEATASLDIRAVPDEDVPALIESMRKLIDDPAIEIKRDGGSYRPSAPPSKLKTDAFRAIETAVTKLYNVPTLPMMLTGATDMAFVRARGTDCYGIGPLTDTEDGPKGFGAHSDQERILERSLHDFVKLNWMVTTELAAAR